MTKTKYDIIFINKMKEFLNKLKILKSEEVIFEDAYNNFCMASRVTPDKVIEQFYAYVYPFSEKVKNRDENFFLKFEYKNIENSADYVGPYSDILKNIWKGISDESKSNIWKYLDLLLLLSNKIHEEKNIN